MRLIITILLTLGFIGCTETSGEVQVWPWEDPVIEEIELPVPATLDKWTDVSADYGTLPEYIKVYKSPEKLEAKLAVAYIAVADMAAAQWDIWSISDIICQDFRLSYRKA